MSSAPLPCPRLFLNTYIRTIVQDVLDACKDLRRPPKREKRPEEHVSKQVYRHLIRMPRYISGPLEPNIESWLPDLESRADIRFSCGKGIETYFIFEAKRLFVTHPGGKAASLVPEYVHEGMMRFIDGRYAPHQQASAMLGYVFDVTTSEAREKVRQAIEDARVKVWLNGCFAASPLRVKPSVDETRHNVGSKPFTLYHLFVSIPPDAISG